MTKDLVYNLKTVAGFLLIAVGVVGGIWVGWWLMFVGNIIEILHMLKMWLPGWGWTVLKFGLSAIFAALFMLLFVILAMMAFSGKEPGK
jgi:hypothetical protein